MQKLIEVNVAYATRSANAGLREQEEIRCTATLAAEAAAGNYCESRAFAFEISGKRLPAEHVLYDACNVRKRKVREHEIHEEN